MDKKPEYKVKCEKGYNLYCRCWNADKDETNNANKIKKKQLCADLANDFQDLSYIRSGSPSQAVRPKVKLSDQKRPYRALVFIVHGFAEHCLYYSELAEFLVAQGYYVFSHDHVGHGQSESDRVHVNNFDEYVDDVYFHVDQIKQKHPDLPVFLIGHSMGGTIALMSCMAHPDYFKGTILIAPLILPDRKTVTPFKVIVAKAMAKLAPQLHIGKLDPSATSRCPEHVKKYSEDPLVYHAGAKCRWGVAMLDALDRIKVRLDKVDWPFLVLHGDKDSLCDIEGSKQLYEKAASQDKEMKVFPDAFHQLHHELEPVKKETFDLIMSWLNKRS